MKRQLQKLAGQPVLVMALLEQRRFEVGTEVQMALSRCSRVYLLAVIPWACAASTQELVDASEKLGHTTCLLDIITDVSPTAA